MSESVQPSVDADESENSSTAVSLERDPCGMTIRVVGDLDIASAPAPRA